MAIMSKKMLLLSLVSSCRCAGVCSYEGRGGLCSIRLSEPLLKLRPRKDLVEVDGILQYVFTNKSVISERSKLEQCLSQRAAPKLPL